MSIEFACPSCSQQIRVKDEFAGRRAKCPSCGSAIEIPEEGSPQTQEEKPTSFPGVGGAGVGGAASRGPSAAPQINPFETTTSAPSARSSVNRSRIELRRVDVNSCAMFVGALYAMLGLVTGGLMFCTALLGSVAGAGQAIEAISFGIVGGLVMLVLFPVLYGLIGLIGGAIAGLLYNLAAHFVGGIKFDIR